MPSRAATFSISSDTSGETVDPGTRHRPNTATFLLWYSRMLTLTCGLVRYLAARSFSMSFRSSRAVRPVARGRGLDGRFVDLLDARTASNPETEAQEQCEPDVSDHVLSPNWSRAYGPRRGRRLSPCKKRANRGNSRTDLTQLFVGQRVAIFRNFSAHAFALRGAHAAPQELRRADEGTSLMVQETWPGGGQNAKAVKPGRGVRMLRAVLIPPAPARIGCPPHPVRWA